MKIAYITSYDAHNVENWSGLGNFIARALAKQGAELTYVGPLTARQPPATRLKRLIYKKALRQKYTESRHPMLLRAYAEEISRKLRRCHADVIFSPGTLPIAYLDSDRPIVFWTDATFAGMVDFYDSFTHLAKAAILEGNRAEQSALLRSSLALYCSGWAAATAVANYRVDPARVNVVPFGANIDCEPSASEVQQFVRSRSQEVCRLLFIGKDWKRKGGDKVVAIAEALNAHGITTELTIVGCHPLLPPSKGIRVIGPISKATREGRQRIYALLAESHFLLLPSTAEAYGLVLCEANAFGLPCLAADAGGIGTIVRDGVNGKLFGREADATEYAAFIRQLMTDYRSYQELALRSFQEYRDRLNWDVAGRRAIDLLRSVA